MGLPRIIIGVILSAIGILSWFKILDENTPKPNESVEISSVWNTDVLLALVIASIICGVGVWILGSGMRSSKSY